MTEIQSNGPYGDPIQFTRTARQANERATRATSPAHSSRAGRGKKSYNQKEKYIGEETLELSGGTNQRSNPNHGRVTRGLALMHDKNLKGLNHSLSRNINLTETS